MMPGRVSVVIPTHDRREYVQEAIDSALAQTYPVLEVIVVDDGSVDGTRAAVKARYGDQIQCFYQENQGESAARNRAIKASTGEYIALLDSDDVWRPTKLERQVAFLEQRPNVGLVSCHVLTMDAQGQLLRTDPLHPEQTDHTVSMQSLVLDSPVHASTILVRRPYGEEVGWFDEEIRYGEDWAFCLRVACRSKIGFAQRALVQLRTHPDVQSQLLVPLDLVERRLRDRLRTVDEVVHSLPGAEASRRMWRDRAAALEWGRAAVGSYLHEDYETATDRLARALALDPAGWGDGAKFAELIFRFAEALVTQHGEMKALRFARNTYRNLPSVAQEWSPAHYSGVRARLHIAFGFLNRQRGCAARVRHHMLQGLWYDPSWLRNRGVVATLVRSCLPEGFRGWH